jgi:hypothetical protein
MEKGEGHILPQAWGEASSRDGRGWAPNRAIHYRRRVLDAPTVRKHLHSLIGKNILPHAGSIAAGANPRVFGVGGACHSC